MVLYTEVDGIYHRWYCSVPKHAVCCLGELELKQVPFFWGAVEVSLLLAIKKEKIMSISYIFITSRIQLSEVYCLAVYPQGINHHIFQEGS